MKDKQQDKQTKILLWKCGAVFIVVILFAIIYENSTSQKKAPAPSVEEVKPPVTEIVDEEELDLEEYLLDEIDKEILETVKVEQIEYYRKYIVNLSLLLRKFTDYENFSKELSFLLRKTEIYPKEVAGLFDELKNFNEKYLSCKIKKYEDLNLGGGYIKKSLNKIFDIKRENPKYNNMIEESKLLKPKLKVLEGYFYSVEFLKMHLSYD